MAHSAEGCCDSLLAFAVERRSDQPAGGSLDPDIPAENIYESDLDPARTPWGQLEGEPCVFFRYTAGGGVQRLPGSLFHTCSDVDIPEHDESTEIFEVDLRLGLLVDRHTDFNLPDTIPIEFERALRDGWSGVNAFGVSGTHNYDEFLASRDNIKISVVHSDGGEDELERVPHWLSVLAWVKYVDTDSGRHYEMRWRASPFPHYDLRNYDGATKEFLPCNSASVLCYLTGYRDARGQELRFDRDANRRLVALTSPNGNWLHFTYGPGEWVARIDDNRGRTVKYAYDERGRLTSVTYPSGEIYSYAYDGTQHMLTFSVAPDAKTVPKVLLRNEYSNGRVTKQTLADGSTYAYSYTPELGDPIRGASVVTPEGKRFVLGIDDSGSIVRQVNSPGR